MQIVPVELSGERAALVPLQEEHLAGLLEAAQAPEIWAYMPLNLMTEAVARAWVADSRAAQAQGTELPFTIFDRETNRIVGSTRYLDISVPNRGLEIGWTWLNPAVWRTRINTECKYLLLRHAFETLDAIRVQFKTDARNLRSQQAIERIGGVREGVLRHHRILPDGYLRDSAYFSILAAEWPEAKRRLEGLLAQQ